MPSNGIDLLGPRGWCLWSLATTLGCVGLLCDCSGQVDSFSSIGSLAPTMGASRRALDSFHFVYRAVIALAATGQLCTLSYLRGLGLSLAMRGSSSLWLVFSGASVSTRA